MLGKVPQIVRQTSPNGSNVFRSILDTEFAGNHIQGTSLGMLNGEPSAQTIGLELRDGTSVPEAEGVGTRIGRFIERPTR
jgi:hypothetical protein